MTKGQLKDNGVKRAYPKTLKTLKSMCHLFSFTSHVMVLFLVKHCTFFFCKTMQGLMFLQTVQCVFFVPTVDDFYFVKACKVCFCFLEQCTTSFSCKKLMSPVLCNHARDYYLFKPCNVLLCRRLKSSVL